MRPGGVGDGPGYHQRQARHLRVLVEILVDGEQRRLAVQGVEDGLDQQHVGAAVDQAAHLLVVGRDQLVEADVARGRVVHVRRDRCRFRGRSQRAGDEAGFVGAAVVVAGGAGDARRLHVHLVGQVAHVIVVLGDAGGAEGIGFDQVGAGRQVALVDFLDHVGPGQGQEFVIALDEQLAGAGTHRGRKIGETLAAVLGFAQLVLLDDGAHGAVEDHDAARQYIAQQGLGRGYGGVGRGHGRLSEGGRRHAAGADGLKLYGMMHEGIAKRPYLQQLPGRPKTRLYVSLCFKSPFVTERYNTRPLSNLSDTYKAQNPVQGWTKRPLHQRND